MIFFAGMLVGLVLGVVGTRLLQRYLAARDRRIEKVRVDEALGKAETPALLDELSKRDDLGETKR